MGRFGAKYLAEGLSLPPTSIHHQIGEWFYYNCEVGSFHTKKLCSRLYSTELKFYSQKRPIRVSSHTFGEVRGNICTSSIARRKARGRFLIRDNLTYFASSYGTDVISRYWSMSAFSEERWATLRANFR